MPASDKTPYDATPFLPPRLTLTSLREAARECEGCPLFKDATQTVFGRGPTSARLVLVGEQPGNDEDLEGQPFIGPAGRILDTALSQAGIDRGDAYVTNAVKHFKFTIRGKRRIHKKPGAREIRACRPWLDAELELIKPEVLVCLGATAAQALLGPDFRVSTQHGQLVPSTLSEHTLATVHPSSILRQPTDADRERAMDDFIEDLKVAAGLLHHAGRR
jgi:uracil-DNA glycosylase family protein